MVMIAARAEKVLCVGFLAPVRIVIEVFLSPVPVVVVIFRLNLFVVVIRAVMIVVVAARLTIMGLYH